MVGSHLDLLTGDMAKAREKEFEKFCSSVETEAVKMSTHYNYYGLLQAMV